MNSLDVKLDDLVKAGAKERKAAAKKKAAPKKAAATKAKAKKGTVKVATKAAAKKGKKGSGSMDVEKAGKKIAAVTGKGKASRAAKIAQKRGTAVTGVASVKDIKATIQREALKLAKTMVKKETTKKGRAGNGKKMRISFRASELSKGTNRNTTGQIAALLSKAPKGRKPAVRQPGAERRVILK